MNRTLVLADAADAATVRRRIGARATVVDEVVRSHTELGCVRFATADGTQLAVLEDHVGEVAYVAITGPAASAWAEVVSREVQCVGVPEALAMLGNGADPRQWIRGLSRLAVLRGEQADPLLVQAWTRALGHPSRAVRRAAIRTCHGAGWPELRALVASRIAADPELRRPLEQLAAHLERLA